MPVLTPKSVFRNWEVDGVPTPGTERKPKKAEIVQLLEQIQTSGSAPAVVRETLADLDLITPAEETYGGQVLNDPDATKNGYYFRLAGEWVKGRGFPDTVAELVEIEGTANAVTAGVEAGVNPADIKVWFIEPLLTNDDDVVLNGLPVRNVNGDELAPGEWPAGRLILLVNRTTEWRLLSDPDADAAAAAAAASAAEAEAERMLAETAAGAAAAAAASVTTGLPKTTVVATSNINLAAPGGTIDGRALIGGNTFLAAAQTDDEDNGPYVWNGAAVAATRVPSYNDFDKISGQYFSVMEGTAYADTLWRCTSNAGGTLGTDALDFEQFASSLESGHGLAASVASGALTISLKRPGGTDPSVANPVNIDFRSVTPGLGVSETLAITSALSLAISSGSTLGIASATAFRVWIGIFNDGGTPRLAAKVCSNSSAIFPLADWQVQSATAEGGAGAADSAGVMYSSAAISSKAFRILGYLDFSTGQAAAGTWATAPDKIQIFDASTPLPGAAIQTTMGTRTTQDSFTSTTYASTNHTASITPLAAANKIAVMAAGVAIVGTSVAVAAIAVQRGGANVGIAAKLYGDVANSHSGVSLMAMDAPGSVASLTYTIAVKATSGAVFWPGSAAANEGGTMFLTEIMG